MPSPYDVRLRGRAKRRDEFYPLGSFPPDMIVALARQFVHRMAIGLLDVSGDDFGTIFASAVEGIHRESPLGVADVVRGKCAWSVKTIKSTIPKSLKTARLISGRCSPDYSLGISDPRANPTATGNAVLSIWNARVNEALDEFDDLRIIVLVRNFASKQFMLFEEEASRFTPNDYKWDFNKSGNLEGYDITSGDHRFTWQPHGAQFTIKRHIPAHARTFSIRNDVPIINMEQVLALTEFVDDWIVLDE